MKDVVLIPTYSRPEFLTITLEHIEQNPDAKEYLYIFALDAWFKRELLQVIQRFRNKGFSVHERRTPRTSYKLGKQSHNVLTGYKLAQEKAKEFVFLIEEDIFVANDFFKWHKAVHSDNPNLFCSIGSRNHNTIFRTSDNLNHYYTSHLDYQSWGVCFRKEKLDLILQHAKEDYYNDPVKYIEKRFPNSKIGKYFVEQDGLIRRVQEELYQHPIAFPHVPRAFHGGFYGYNRGRKIEGTLAKKIEELRRICFSDSEMKKVNTPRFYEDSRPENLDIPEWTPPVEEVEAEKIKVVLPND